MDFSGNKTLVGVIVLLLLLFAAAVFVYNRTLNDLAAGSCSDTAAGGSCSHLKIVETQNIVIAALLLVIALIAVYFAYNAYFGKSAEPSQRASSPLQPSAQPRQSRKVNLSELDSDEKRIVSLLQERQGSVFQSEVIKLTGFTKVKVSRILDKMENNGLIERKRRGMANLVVLR